MTFILDTNMGHYLRAGSNQSLRFWTAFDLAKWNKLIQRLLNGLPAIVVCVLLYSLENQYVWARSGEAEGAHSSR